MQSTMTPVASSNRIDTTFARLRAEGRKAFVAYITAGDPNLDTTPSLVYALEEAGVDVVELGVPFSDPLADGVVNQLAAQRALEAGTTLSGILDTVRLIRKKSTIPLVLFTYLNPLLRYGMEKFSQDAESAGVDGVLILDLPPEEIVGDMGLPESSPLRRISLIAPTSPEQRVAAIAGASSGFIYYVLREGVTGMRSDIPPAVSQRLDEIRRYSDVPVCVGFGISTPDQARAMAAWADGIIIGSALVARVAEWGARPRDAQPSLPDLLRAFAKPLADAIHGVA
ncbi:MAG TPA: tryptophan synthase subunit alpha [Candidatus Methylacidiphilales bacterium]|nr:tryptophan synthase subunit alpha [Candidatus Methylacidiphilales bacterium]